MRLTRKKYQEGGSMSMECPDVSLNPQLNSQNEANAVNNGDVAFIPTGGTQEQACGNCAAFDISKRMNECTQDTSQEMGLCWTNDFKCPSSGICQQWGQGGPIVDDQLSYEMGQKKQAPQEQPTDPSQQITPEMPMMDPAMMAPGAPAMPAAAPQMMKYGGEVPTAKFGGSCGVSKLRQPKRLRKAQGSVNMDSIPGNNTNRQILESMLQLRSGIDGAIGNSTNRQEINQSAIDGLWGNNTNRQAINQSNVDGLWGNTTNMQILDNEQEESTLEGLMRKGTYDARYLQKMLQNYYSGDTLSTEKDFNIKKGGGTIPQAAFGYTDNYGMPIQGSGNKFNYVNDNFYNPAFHNANYNNYGTSAPSAYGALSNLGNLGKGLYGLFNNTRNAINDKNGELDFKKTTIENPTGRAIATDYTTNDQGNMNMFYVDEKSDYYNNVMNNSYFTKNKNGSGDVLHASSTPVKNRPTGSPSLEQYYNNFDLFEGEGKEKFGDLFDTRLEERKDEFDKRYGGSLPQAQGGYRGNLGVNLNLPKISKPGKYGFIGGAAAGLGYSMMNDKTNIYKNQQVRNEANDLMCTAASCPTGNASTNVDDYVSRANLNLGYGKQTQPGIYSTDSFVPGKPWKALGNTALNTIGGGILGGVTTHGVQKLANKLAPRTFANPGKLFKQEGGDLPKAQSLGEFFPDPGTGPEFDNMFNTASDGFNNIELEEEQINNSILDDTNLTGGDNPFDFDPSGNAFMINKYNQTPSSGNSTAGFTQNQSEDPYADGVTVESTYGESFLDPSNARRDYMKEQKESGRYDGLTGKDKRQEKQLARQEKWDLDEDGIKDKKFGSKEYNQIREKIDKPLDIFGSIAGGVVDAAGPLTNILKKNRFDRQRADIIAQQTGSHNVFETQKEGMSGSRGDFTLNEGMFRPDDKDYTRFARYGGWIPQAQENAQPIGPYRNPYQIGLTYPIGGRRQGEIPMSEKMRDFLGMDTEQTPNAPNMANPFMFPGMQAGGGFADIDEQMLAELIAAGAQIENM